MVPEPDFCYLSPSLIQLENREIQLFVYKNFSHESNPDECTMLVKQYWKVLAPKVFTQDSAGLACNGLNPECQMTQMTQSL